LKNLVKSKVDEKNLDEEISKIKDRLSLKIAEREKSRRDKAPANNVDDDDFFNTTTQRNSRNRPADEDEMDINERPTARKKRVAQEISDDDVTEMPISKKPRKAPSKPTVSRPRQSSESSNPPPAIRKTPSRAAASRAKKVTPTIALLTVDNRE